MGYGDEMSVSIVPTDPEALALGWPDEWALEFSTKNSPTKQHIAVCFMALKVAGVTLACWTHFHDSLVGDVDIDTALLCAVKGCSDPETHPFPPRELLVARAC
jgi:hypothetical protein